jgi:hypothetical protein
VEVVVAVLITVEPLAQEALVAVVLVEPQAVAMALMVQRIPVEVAGQVGNFLVEATAAQAAPALLS